MYDKDNYVIHIRNLKQALGHQLILKKVHKVIQFNQAEFLKEYIDINTKLKIKAKNDFEKDFFKLINTSIFEKKTMENVRIKRAIRLVTTDKKRSKLASDSDYNRTKWFLEDLLTKEMNKIKVRMDRPVYLALSILELSRTLMYEF